VGKLHLLRRGVQIAYLALGKRREGSILCISDGSGCIASLIQDPVSQAWLQRL